MEVAQQAGVPDGWTVVPPSAPPAPMKGRDFKVLGVNIHVPGEEKPRADSNIIGTASGAGIAPEDLLMAGQAGRAVIGAASKGGGLAGVTEAVSQAAPQIKYEATKTLLETMGVPAPLAMAAAMVVSGYKKGAKAETGPVDAAAPHLDRSVSVRPSDLTPAQLRERVMYGTGTPPPTVTKPPIAPRGVVEPSASVPAPPVSPDVPSAQSVPPPPSVEAPPSRPVNNLPDQKALNEAALARRRAAYQASQAATTPTVAAKPTLLASEAKEYLKLIQAGKTPKEAFDAIEAQRALIRSFGSPTDAEAKAAIAARQYKR